MSLLHDVLRPTRDVDSMTSKLAGLSVPDGSPQGSRSASPAQAPAIVTSDTSDSDDELIGVVSVPGTPRRLQSRQTSRSSSPSRVGAAARRAPGPLLLSSKLNSKGGSRPGTRSSSKAPRSKTDPVRMPSEVVQNIFARLGIKDLARCSRVSVKWNTSQNLNYVWYQHDREVTLGGGDGKPAPPQGKWTKAESKKSWRQLYMIDARKIAENDPNTSIYGYANSNPPSGYSTPREVREDRWAQENSGLDVPTFSKTEMREMYKATGGRKAKTKTKVGMGGGSRDKGGYDSYE